MQFSKWITLGFGALCLVAVAGLLRAPHLYYMAAILLTLPGVSYLLGWYALHGMEFTREMPHVAWEGEEGGIAYVARNPTRFARFFLSIQENVPGWNAVGDEEPPLFNVAALDMARVTHTVRFSRRGVYQAAGFDVTAMDPLGVFAFSRHVSAEGELVVYPLPQALRTSAFSGTERYGWQEFTSRLLRGSSVDPDGVRPYVAGDPMRRIHWRQTARTGKLSVIEFEESQATNLVIALDLEASTEVGTGDETTLEYGVRLTASLAQQAIEHGTSVRLMLPPDGAGTGKDAELMLTAATMEGRGEAHLFLILDALARVKAISKVSMRQTVEDNAARVLPGTTLLVVTANPDLNLSGAFASYLAIGVKISVAFIDPDTFEGKRFRRGNDDSGAFLASLASLRLPAFVVRCAPNGVLDPEEVTYDIAGEGGSPSQNSSEKDLNGKNLHAQFSR